MSALKNFERLYKFDPFDFMKKLNAENFAIIKSRNFTQFIAENVKEQYGIEANETFFKFLVETFQEAGERFPQNQLLNYGDILMELEVNPLSPNIPKSKGIIEDFKQIVSDDDLRPAMKGVYFEDGKMIATDGHCLITDYDNNEFTKHYDKKIIDVALYVKSKGQVVKVIDEKFPNYDAVIPKTDFTYEKTIDLYSLYNLGRSAAFYLKLLRVSNVRLRCKIKDEEFALNPILLSDVCEYFLKKGSTSAEMKYTAANKAIVMNFGGSMGLIMPIVNREDYNIATTLDYDLEKLEDFKGGGKIKSETKPKQSTKSKETKSEIKQEDRRSESYRKYTGKFQGDSEYIPRREIEKIILKSGEVLRTNDIIDGIYKAKKKFEDGGEFDGGGSISKEFVWTFDVSFSHGKRNQPKVMGRHWVTVSATTEKGAIREVNKEIRRLYQGDTFNYIRPSLVSKETDKQFYESERRRQDEFGFADGGEFGGGGVTKNLKRIVRKGTKYGKIAVKKAKPTAKRIVKKAKIGFKALADKVAKAYEGKAVKPKYQKEYGKTYSKTEAKEVGNKVAAKVKRLKGM